MLDAHLGQGTGIGHRFEQLAQPLEMIDQKRRVGICLDTCHVFAAGYDITTYEAYMRTIDRFERSVGSDKKNIERLLDLINA